MMMKPDASIKYASFSFGTLSKLTIIISSDRCLQHYVTGQRQQLLPVRMSQFHS